MKPFMRLASALSDCLAFFSLTCFVCVAFFLTTTIGRLHRLLMYAAVLTVMLLAYQLILLHFKIKHVPPVSQKVADWLSQDHEYRQ